MVRRMGTLCALPPPRAVGRPALGACGSRPAFHHLEPSRNSASFWPDLGCVVEAQGPGDPRGSGFQDCGFGDGVSRLCPGVPKGLVGGEGARGWSWTVGGRWAWGVQPLGSHLESSWSPKACEAIWKKLRGPHGGCFRLPSPINLTVGHETPSERSCWTIVQT